MEHEIQDLYSAETQLISALPKMAEAAHSSKLKQAFKDHLQETKNQQARLEKVADILGCSTKGETCEAMKGLIKEGEKMIKEDAEPDVKDAGLIAAAQRVEHYEIAGYGTARHFAKILGLQEVADLLEETLEEEKDADEKLNDIAIQQVDPAAMNGR